MLLVTCLHIPYTLTTYNWTWTLASSVVIKQTVHIVGVESDQVTGLNLHILVGQEVIRKLWGACHLTGSL